MKIIHFRILFFALILTLHHGLLAQMIDFSKASIIASSQIASPFREKMMTVLQEEIVLKTSLKLSNNPNEKSALFILAIHGSGNVSSYSLPTLSQDAQASIQKEGFRIIHQNIAGKDVLWLIGADQRGLLFAIGEFLRTADLSKQKILFDKKYEKSSAPMYAIRGHQIGYRNTANSWDAWDFNQFERYFRELAFFGTNAIENIPFQDGAASPHMKINREEMHIKMSQMCQAYDLDYWVWTPADVDLADPKKFQEELKAHVDFYKNCPRLDGVFFPGGDPGENHPKYVLPFLKAVAAELKKYHPKAGVWLSLQGFNDEEVNYFYDYLAQNKPDWFTGIVTGPSSPDLAATRFRLDKKYLHRHYPDLTHTVRCQYPTENWDQAFALTEGREVTNPQPAYYAKIHNRYAPFTDGFLSYSDGVHDDVNKVIWSQMAWNTEKEVRQVMVEYARYFFGNSVAEAAADGILALERNWVGAIEENGGIETTFAFWQNLEKSHPELKANWRWQQLVMRAYYDTFIKRRKLYEQGLEKEANAVLNQAAKLGAENAMTLALEKVNQADQKPAAPELRQKVVDYCEALFQTIGLQTSVSKYKASGAERGAILDFIDYPLNNRWWLQDEFEKIRKMPNENAKLERLQIIATWENPGKGSYYDNISDQLKGPRVKTRTEDATDVAWWDNGLSRRRLSTQLFQNFPQLEYADLDPQASYTIRISGQGDALLRVDGERVRPVMYNKGVEEFKEFQLNPKFISDGKISISFDEPEESHLNWRQHSKVFDIWLLKK
ncbi:hypothetical protein [Aquirufa aurantiipilula]|uniref:Alpha glucuronidase N-terminal domain-containing protein n=1 Tax=Aquirufa aurantiipilula TaxID=2696561 RepID=A0ABT6BGJ5_9BACT|nr:hypothetical protein [Aquirufa aurantiipilula]MDF5689457.1 hypothetical protein [Aquirufa aurantiipilula]